MIILELEIIHYPREAHPWWSAKTTMPSLELVLNELATMDNYEKPLLMLYQDPEETESNSLRVTGGSGLYHIEVSQSDYFWLEAYDPNVTDEIVDIWLSDQGMQTERKKAFEYNKAKEIVTHYFNTGKMFSGVSWGKC